MPLDVEVLEAMSVELGSEIQSLEEETTGSRRALNLNSQQPAGG